MGAPVIEPSLWISGAHWQQMRNHVIACLPEEACGIAAGLERRVLSIIPVKNELSSRDRFRMDGREQVRAILDIEKRGWQFQAIYHSHPQGPPHPSPTDLQEYAYPGVLYLIWSLMDGGWHCHGFEIDGASYRVVSLAMIEDEQRNSLSRVT